MLSKEQILDRNKLIADNGRKTRMKRAKQICKTFKFKIDWDNLNLSQKETLKMMFVEAKWIYNYLLSQDDIYSFDYKNINLLLKVSLKLSIFMIYLNYKLKIDNIFWVS